MKLIFSSILVILFFTACKEEKTVMAIFEVTDAQTKRPLKNANIVIQNCESSLYFDITHCNDFETLNTDSTGKATFIETYTSDFGNSKAFRVDGLENYKATENRTLEKEGEQQYFIKLKPAANVRILINSSAIYNQISFNNYTVQGAFFERKNSFNTNDSISFTTQMIPEEINKLRIQFLQSDSIIKDSTLEFMPKYGIENQYSINF